MNKNKAKWAFRVGRQTFHSIGIEQLRIEFFKVVKEGEGFSRYFRGEEVSFTLQRNLPETASQETVYSWYALVVASAEVSVLPWLGKTKLEKESSLRQLLDAFKNPTYVKYDNTGFGYFLQAELPDWFQTSLDTCEGANNG